MKLLTRMVFVQVMKNSLFVLFSLVALFAFFDLINQTKKIGTVYTIAEAFLLTGLSLPSLCYEILPIAVMLGAIFTLSRFAATSQFTVMRVTGIGPLKFCTMLMIPGMVLVLSAYALGEFLAPPSQRLAKELKLDFSNSAFTGKELDSGIWVRDVQRGPNEEVQNVSFVNVRSLKPGEAAYNWQIYVFNNKNEISSIITAKKGVYSEEQGWVLQDVKEEIIPNIPKMMTDRTKEKVVVRSLPTLVWGKSLDSNIFGLLMVKPEDMSLAELYHYIEYLKDNGQAYKRFDTAFWSKAFYPLAILVMLVLSMPFAYQSARAGGYAIKIFLGIMIGILYYALNNLFAFMSALEDVPPFVSAMIPSLIMLTAATAAIWFVETRT